MFPAKVKKKGTSPDPKENKTKINDDKLIASRIAKKRIWFIYRLTSVGILGKERGPGVGKLGCLLV